MEVLGIVSELWRYPVKSMLGERCESVLIHSRGVDGNRLYAVADANGKFGSGKNTRRFRRRDNLFQYEARYVNEVPVITLPNGETIRGDSPDVNTILSEACGELSSREQAKMMEVIATLRTTVSTQLWEETE